MGSDTIQEEKDSQKEDEAKVVNGYVASLLQLNPETVGWLTLNNTNVDFPLFKELITKD